MSIHQLIATINPDVFCQRSARPQTKAALRDAVSAGDKLAYLKASQVAVPCESNVVALEKLWEENLFHLPGQRSPTEQHVLIIDNPAEPLEPIYFELLHALVAREDWTVERLLDTASATTGAGLGVDLSRRTAFDQHEAAKLLSAMRQRIRSFVQDWQKWRDQKRQLTLFAQAQQPESSTSESARRRLSHQWQRDFATTEADREAVFEHWLKESEADLKSQVQISRELLAGDLQWLRLQANWLKPYLRAQPGSPRHANDAAMVNVFNTAIFEIVLLVKVDSLLEPMVQSGELPKMLLNARHRRSQPVLVVEIQFQAIPERVNGGAYAYRGRAELRFTSYALREDEITVLRRELNRSEWGEVLGLLETNLAGQLNALLNDLDELLTGPKPAVDADSQREVPSDPNPFLALFDFSDWFAKPQSQPAGTLVEPLNPDTDTEAVIRSLALLEARQRCLELYNQSKARFHLPEF